MNNPQRACAVAACSRDCLDRPYPRESAVFGFGSFPLPVCLPRRNDVRALLLREDVLRAGDPELQRHLLVRNSVRPLIADNEPPEDSAADLTGDGRSEGGTVVLRTVRVLLE